MQTGAIEAVKQEKAVPEKGGRNYELDFFRLVFALLVFIYHTNPFIGKNTRVVLPPDLGAGAVHFFFILSGMFYGKQHSKARCDRKLRQVVNRICT